MNTNMEDPKPFKVVIVGAGISGLGLAHLLARANIDFTLIEAHKDIVHPSGGSYGIWPNAARILDQLGCWEDIEKTGAPLETNYVRSQDGSPLIASRTFVKLAAEYGYRAYSLERPKYVRILYEKLPDKSRILTEKRVTDIIEQPDGVRVVFEDGACEGDIVVGCDGVHSTVRQLMWENANRLSPGLITAIEKRSLTSSFRCLVGVAPFIPGLGQNVSHVIQNQGRYMFIVTQPGQTLFFVCIKEKSTSYWPQRSHFTTEDADKEAANIAHLPVTTDLLFGEIWMKRTRSYLCPLEEGVFEHWYFNRIVLLGDSAHKLSPVGAQGGSCALESAAALVNSLKQNLRHLHPDTRPNQETIDSVFKDYQRLRKARVNKIYNAVHFMTRVGSWDTYTMKFFSCYVLPWVDETAACSALIREAVKADFLPAPRSAKGFADNVRPSDQPVAIKQSQLAWMKATTFAWTVGLACTVVLVMGHGASLLSALQL